MNNKCKEDTKTTNEIIGSKTDETTSGRRCDNRYILFVAKKDSARKGQPKYDLPRLKFNTSHKSLMTKEVVVDKLQFLKKIDCTLGSQNEA